MDDAPLVGVLKRFSQLDCQRERLIDGERPTRNSLGKRRSLDEFHDDGANGAFVGEAVDLSDVWVIEGRECLRFAIEAREALRIEGKFGR
jgi:hypothetical protein